MMSAPYPPLHTVLPPLIMGTAVFNTQYHPDPTHMPYESIVRRALLHHKVAAFDTSPYYGPSELLLGSALAAIDAPRSSYMVITKAGRIAAETFDYSPSAIRASVHRSLSRLHTPYLDLVYAHDVEFVTPQEVLEAVRELRRLRDEEGLIRYVGISGYPVEVLASLAEMILAETGEPLDAVLSYSHFCVQNTQLASEGVLGRFKDAGIDCLLNASILSMGLLTTRGVDAGPMASWHPAPKQLRRACHNLRTFAESEGEHLERVSILWSLDRWLSHGAQFGTTAVRSEDNHRRANEHSRVGISVMGVSTVDELDETIATWRSVVRGPQNEVEAQHRQKIIDLVENKMWPSLAQWKDYSWPSGMFKGKPMLEHHVAEEAPIDINLHQPLDKALPLVEVEAIKS